MIPKIPQTANLVIFPASMAISLPTLSKSRKFPSLRSSYVSVYASAPADGQLSSYSDLYLSTQKGPASFFGNRSIVVHTNNATRLNCANFTLVAGNSTIGGGAKPSNAAYGSYTGGSAARLFSGSAVLAALAAFLL